MDIAYKYFAAAIPFLCFLSAACGTILLAPKPLMNRHRRGISLTAGGIMGYASWIVWDVTRDWVNTIVAIIISIIVIYAVYKALTDVRIL